MIQGFPSLVLCIFRLRKQPTKQALKTFLFQLVSRVKINFFIIKHQLTTEVFFVVVRWKNVVAKKCQ